MHNENRFLDTFRGHNINKLKQKHANAKNRISVEFIT